MSDASMLRTGLTPVVRPSDNLQKRVAYALQGKEADPQECFSNPFALDTYRVTDVDGEDYDVREVLHYINTGHGYGSESPILLPCPKTTSRSETCVNSLHTKVFTFSHVSKYRFFLERNPVILEHVRFSLRDLTKCWYNNMPTPEEQQMLRQMVAIAFGLFDSGEVGHIKLRTAYGVVMTLKDGSEGRVSCPRSCVNPYHAPLPPSSYGQQQQDKTDAPVEESESDFEAYLKFKDYVFTELAVSRGHLVCGSSKLAYSTEDVAIKARSKWIGLGLSKFGAARVYKCHKCVFWHLSSQKLRSPSSKKRNSKTRQK